MAIPSKIGPSTVPVVENQGSSESEGLKIKCVGGSSESLETLSTLLPVPLENQASSLNEASNQSVFQLHKSSAEQNTNSTQPSTPQASLEAQEAFAVKDICRLIQDICTLGKREYKKEELALKEKLKEVINLEIPMAFGVTGMEAITCTLDEEGYEKRDFFVAAELKEAIPLFSSNVKMISLQSFFVDRYIKSLVILRKAATQCVEGGKKPLFNNASCDNNLPLLLQKGKNRPDSLQMIIAITNELISSAQESETCAAELLNYCHATLRLVTLRIEMLESAGGVKSSLAAANESLKKGLN